jgi:hypothetical protein
VESLLRSRRSREITEEGRFRTTPEALSKHFDGVPQARIGMEAGTHSVWVSEHLREFGHEVIVANVQELRALTHSDRKSDRVDAEKRARYARLDPKVLRPISPPQRRHAGVAHRGASPGCAGPGTNGDRERGTWFVQALRLSPSGFFDPLFPKTCPSRRSGRIATCTGTVARTTGTDQSTD